MQGAGHAGSLFLPESVRVRDNFECIFYLSNFLPRFGQGRCERLIEPDHTASEMDREISIGLG